MIPILLFYFSLYPNISISGQLNLVDVFIRTQPRPSNVFTNVLQPNFVVICVSCCLKILVKKSLSHFTLGMNIFVRSQPNFIEMSLCFCSPSRHFSKEPLIFLSFCVSINLTHSTPYLKMSIGHSFPYGERDSCLTFPGLSCPAPPCA